jgi:hypothetical protein
MQMKALFGVVALLGLLAAVSIPANAFPLLDEQIVSGNGSVVKVGWMCGPYRHWSWFLHRCWNR